MKNINRSIIFSLFVLYALTSGKVFAQGEANTWYFGTKGGLSFNGATPTKLNNSLMNLTNKNGEGMASISNAAGNILFYTDGISVYRGDHSGTLTNGTGLAGNTSSAQTALIVPVPGSTNLYYIFSTPGVEQSTVSGDGVADGYSGLRYSIVNTTTNTVSAKNTLLTPAGIPVTEGQTAVPHSDGTSFWLICKQAGNKTSGAASNNFYSYRIGTNNINATTGVINALNGTADEVISAAGSAIPGVVGAPGVESTNGIVSIKSNSCFNKLAVAFFAIGAIGKRVELFNFSNTSGAISLANAVTNFDAGDPNEIYGVEFSPNGNLLYLTVMNYNSASNAVRGSLYQFDISSGVNATINAAGQRYKNVVDTVSSRGIGALQLGPDGKIYYTFVQNDPLGGGGPDPSYIGRIVNPNVKGAGALFVDAFIGYTNATDPGVGLKMGLPQIYKGFIAGQVDFGDDLPTVAGVKIICQNTSVNFTINFTGSMKPGTLDVDWGDGVVQTNIAGTPTSVSHTYTTTGNKTVTITFEDICDNPYSLTTPLSVVSAPTGTITCVNPDKLRFDVTSPTSGTSTYIWFKTATGADAWGTGTTYTTPSLTAPFPSDVYLLEANGSGGTVTTLNPTAPVDNFGAIVTNNISVLKQVYMQSFDVVPYTNSTCAGTITATIRNSSNVVMATVTVNSPAACGAVTIPINVLLPVDTYTITMASTGTIAGFNYQQSWHASIPYTAAGLMADNGSGGGNAGPAFNFKLINALASCNRVQITASCSLPVTWLDFTGLRSNQSVVLNWSTATEENNKVFHVQRSVDGVNFITIDHVLTAGNGNVVRHYEYMDLNAPSGSVYYRLVQEDINGASSNSKIVIVGASGKLDLALVPNPGNGSFTITGLATDVKLNVAVYSITGQSVFTTLASPGQIIDLEGIAKGFYIVKIVSGTTEQSIRYINQ